MQYDYMEINGSVKKKKKFDIRSFISFGLLFSFIIMSLTGIVLYFTPPGRVAKWVKWTFFGLEKEEWQAVHTIFSYFFMILGIFHVFSFNWKVIVAYIKKRSVSGINKKKELIVSSLVILFLFFGTLYNVQPLKGIMDFGEYLTESWETRDEAAPVPHTEDMTIEELSKNIIKLDPESIIKKLTGKGIKANENETLKDIGITNNFSPLEVYRIIASDEEKKKETGNMFRSGRGMRRRTLIDYAEILQTDVGKILSGLKEYGIEASVDERIKDLAEKYEMSPYEFVEKLKIIKNKKEK